MEEVHILLLGDFKKGESQQEAVVLSNNASLCIMI